MLGSTVTIWGKTVISTRATTSRIKKGTAAAATRMYRSSERNVPALNRGLVTQRTTSQSTYLEADAFAGGQPITFYQVVAVSCAGNLEGPY